jgi:hypothetical protein
MKTGIEIAGSPFVVEFDYRVTSRAVPPSRDDPGSGLEFEITLVSLYPDEPKKDSKPVPVPIPDWLRDVIVQNLQESYDIVDQIEAEEEMGEDDR